MHQIIGIFYIHIDFQNIKKLFLEKQTLLLLLPLMVFLFLK